MPAFYKIDTEQRLVRFRAWGVMTNADARDYYHRLAADPRFEPSFRSIADMEAVTHFTLEARVAAETASWPVFDAGTRRAIIAPSAIAYGLARMFSSYAGNLGQNVQVFQTEIEALMWLNSLGQAGQEPECLPSTRGVRARDA